VNAIVAAAGERAVLAAIGETLLLGVGAAVLLLHVIGLPANWILLGLALLHALATGGHPVGWGTLLVLAAVAAVAEGLEFLVGMWITARRGASRWGMVGACAGGIVGVAFGAAVPVPLLGVLVGGFLGSFLGAVLLEYVSQRRLDAALRSGRAAFLGRVLGASVKTVCGFGMWAILVWRVLAAHSH
jgi:uncharacterized protein YqgC (DUF456 family)